MLGSVEHAAIPKKIWTVSGVTEHLGGIRATRNLLTACQVVPHAIVVDLGCGTGYSASLLAKSQPQRIIALDLNSSSLKSAQSRLQKSGSLLRINLVQADIHAIPLQDGCADTVIAESVLVFCDLPLVLPGIQRVLRTGGICGFNEMTLLKPPPARLTAMLKDVLGIQPYSQPEWEANYRQAGFEITHSGIHPIRLADQLTSHLRVDGLFNYLKAVAIGLRDDSLRRTFINWEMGRAFLAFRSYIGYGMYVMKKK